MKRCQSLVVDDVEMMFELIFWARGTLSIFRVRVMPEALLISKCDVELWYYSMYLLYDQNLVATSILWNHLPMNFWGGRDSGTLSIFGVRVMPEALLISEKFSHWASGNVWFLMVTSNCGGGAGTCLYSVTRRLWRSMSSMVFFSVMVRKNTSSTTWEVISGFL